MTTLSSKEKAALRSVAQTIKPAVHLGKQGLTEGVVVELLKAFDQNQLIKVAFKADREAIPALVAEVEIQTQSICVGGVGKRRSFYRPDLESEEA